MNTQIVRGSLLALVLSLSACAAAPIDSASDGEPTAEAASALAGGPWTWVDDATGRCLDSNGDGKAYTLGCNDGDHQKWTNVPSTYGDQIIDKATGRCLDSNANGDVYTLPCNGGNYQQWGVGEKGPHGRLIVNAATWRCLDSNGNGDVYTRSCNGGNYQYWH